MGKSAPAIETVLKLSQNYVLVGMWEKGEVISSFYPGKLRNWNQIEQVTGRAHESLQSRNGNKA